MGLTRDLGTPKARRVAKPDLLGLLYATLIAYPRYFDPITRLPCPVEVVVERLNEPTRAPRRNQPHSVKASGALCQPHLALSAATDA